MDVQQENQQLRQLVTELIIRGNEPRVTRPTLDLPVRCECEAMILHRYTFDPASFTFSQPDEKLNAQFSGTVVEISIHGIDDIGGKVVCRRCHRNIVSPQNSPR